MKTKRIEDVRVFAEKVAQHQGWRLHPDREFREMVLQGLLVNYNRYGYYQCPCRDSWADKTKDRDILCPCVYCKPDLAEYGRCFCSLFMTEEFVRSGVEAQPIPDRRPKELYP